MQRRLFAGRINLSAKLLSGFVLFVALTAQDEPDVPDKSDEVVVTGLKEAGDEARRRAAAYVRGLGIANGEQAVARWIEPVCPKALGLSEPHARHVEGQIRKIAESLGVATAGRPCQSNITVSFVSNAGAVVRRIAQREPPRFKEVPFDRRPSLLHGDAPVRWWYSTELRGRHGDRPVAFAPPAVKVEGGGSLPLGSDTQVLSLYNSSLVSTQTVRALRSATIVVDVDRAEGATLDSVAAYAAMVALAEIRFSDGPRPGSILSLFGGAASATELTEWDRAFLRELYRLPLDRVARYQRGRLVGALVSEPDLP